MLLRMDNASALINPEISPFSSESNGEKTTNQNLRFNSEFENAKDR